MNKEVWLLVDSSAFGGIESHVLELAAGLTRRIDIRVVMLNNGLTQPLAAKLHNKGVDVSFCRFGIYSFLFMLLRVRPILIHTHGYKSGILARIFSVFFRYKTISTFHAGESLSGKLRAYDWLDRHSAAISSHVFSVSKNISNKIPRKNEVIKNFIDVDGCSRSHGSQIAFVGRLSYEKGPDLFSELSQKNRIHDFHMYGGGPMDKEIEMGKPKNLFLHGSQNDMDRVWEKIAVLIVPSRAEGMPMAIIEALSRGIPVIAFNVGEIQGMIDNGVNGWVCTSDNVEALGVCLDQWLKLSCQEKRIMADNAIKKARKNFSVVSAVPNYIRVYKKHSPQLIVDGRR